MIYKDIYKNGTDPATGDPVSKLIRLGYEGTTLYVYEVVVVNEQEELVPSMVQPWKCNSDGTRSDFVDSEDAFTWADSVKNTLF